MGKAYFMPFNQENSIDPEVFLSSRMAYTNKLKKYPDVQYLNSPYYTRLVHRLGPGQQKRKDRSDQDRLHNRR